LHQIPIDEAADAAEAKTLASGVQDGPAVGGYQSDSSDEDDEEEDDDEEELNVSGSPIDGNHLEDSSDDEEDDQRPASNPSGARPIPTW
jgi:hypothetical protein